MKAVAVIGCSPDWEADFNKLKEICSNLIIVAVGLDCPYKGRVDYFATLHIEDIIVYYDKRQKEGLNTDYKVIAHTNDFIKYEKEHRKKVAYNRIKIDIVCPYEPPSGSSALLATNAMIKEGFDKIVLCGCPLEGMNKTKQSYVQFQKGWKKHRALLGDKVRSMSGWTRELLGEPNLEWIKGDSL